MIDVMHQAEDLENLENLHSLCSLMQTIRELRSLPFKGRLNPLRSLDERSQHVRAHFG